jgi:methylenetetrahydrofolate dehydrogenase (NADP+)/methenyltetrahydrofolate cyclohydrolase
MKLLKGAEIAEYIKERQAHQVRSLIQSAKIKPKIAIIVCNNNPVINKYIELKKQYGEDILVEVDIYKVVQSKANTLINKLNQDKSVQGIIVQLPLKKPKGTEEIINLIDPKKDVDGLVKNSRYDPATPTAIIWLLAGYNIDLVGKNIVLIGQGRLVGKPLIEMMQKSGLEPSVIDIDTKNPQEIMSQAQIIISAVGKPGIINSIMVPQNCVVIDAATASEGGQIKGDLDDDVYEREDLTITPQKGGVGPLTICALFDNLIRACQ